MKDINQMLKKPLAWLPIAMSVAALLDLLGYVVLFGIQNEPQTDEGIAAHIFQLLLATQLPIIIVFAVVWFPKEPKQVLKILLLQIVAALVPLALLFYLEL